MLALAAWPRGPEPDADLRDLTVAVDALGAAVLAQREILRLEGYKDFVTSVTFSPDGTRLATASRDGTARIWDGATGVEILRLEGHERGVYSVAFSPDGTRLATAAEDGTARIWNINIGDGNLFQIACLRRPTLSLPKILESYGIDIGEPICSGDVPLPPSLTEEDTK